MWSKSLGITLQGTVTMCACVIRSNTASLASLWQQQSYHIKHFYKVCMPGK